MALIDDIKVSLRVSAEAYDSEVRMLIDAALYDMWRVGVNPRLLEPVDDDLPNGFVKQAVTAYCKANFGYDDPEASRFDDAYRRIVCDLMNSSENVAAIAAEEPNEEPAQSDADSNPDEPVQPDESVEGGE